MNHRNEDFRNYDKEARDMVSKLNRNECYALYEVAISQLQRSQSETRDKELKAVMKAIESRRDLDHDRIAARKRGFGSSMAADARAKDGQTDKHKKKV